MDTTALARRLLGAAPVHRTFGLEVARSGDGRSEVALPTVEALSNVIGSTHASGLVTLLDAAGLAAIVGGAESEDELDGVLPLGSAATMRFLAPARGRLVATCELSVDARAAVRAVLSRADAKARLVTTALVHDEDDAVVAEGTFTWSLRRS